jgi:hypothetical protein
VADVAEGGWVPTFSRVVRFEARNLDDILLGMFLSKFHNTIKALHVGNSHALPSQLVNLIYLIPLLEDLSLIGSDLERGEPATIISSSTPPPLNGTLGLYVSYGIAGIVRLLLDIPSGLHFRKLKLTSSNFACVGKLVDACSGTLECLGLQRQGFGAILSVHLVTGN